MNPIQSLQHMLNHLARTTPSLPRLAESGTFDEPTLEAVMIVQRDFGLPVTGIVDQATWDTVTNAYYLNLFETGKPPLLHVLSSGNTAIQESETDLLLHVVQAMFSALQKVITNFEETVQSGSNSSSTTRNLRLLQRLASLPESGTLDRSTWAILAHLYRALITRRAMDSYPL